MGRDRVPADLLGGGGPAGPVSKSSWLTPLGSPPRRRVGVVPREDVGRRHLRGQRSRHLPGVLRLGMFFPRSSSAARQRHPARAPAGTRAGSAPRKAGVVASPAPVTVGGLPVVPVDVPGPDVVGAGVPGTWYQYRSPSCSSRPGAKRRWTCSPWSLPFAWGAPVGLLPAETRPSPGPAAPAVISVPRPACSWPREPARLGAIRGAPRGVRGRSVAPCATPRSHCGRGLRLAAIGPARRSSAGGASSGMSEQFNPPSRRTHVTQNAPPDASASGE